MNKHRLVPLWFTLPLSAAAKRLLLADSKMDREQHCQAAILADSKTGRQQYWKAAILEGSNTGRQQLTVCSLFVE